MPAGMLSMMCDCVNVPLGNDLRKRKANSSVYEEVSERKGNKRLNERKEKRAAVDSRVALSKTCRSNGKHTRLRQETR